MKTTDALIAYRAEITDSLALKTNWGRNEILKVLDTAMLKIQGELINSLEKERSNQDGKTK